MPIDMSKFKVGDKVRITVHPLFKDMLGIIINIEDGLYYFPNWGIGHDAGYDDIILRAHLRKVIPKVEHGNCWYIHQETIENIIHETEFENLGKHYKVISKIKSMDLKRKSLGYAY